MTDALNHIVKDCDRETYVVATRDISSEGIHAMRFELVCQGNVVAGCLTIHDLIELDASIQQAIKLHDHEE